MSQFASDKDLSAFTSVDQLAVRALFGAQIRGRYAHGERLTIGDVELDADTIVPMHQHEHEQITYLLQGTMHFTVGDERRTMQPGDIAIIPSGIVHGGHTVTKCRVVDVFAPARDDYR